MKKLNIRIVIEAIFISLIFTAVVLFVYRIGMSRDFFVYTSEGISLEATMDLFREYTKKEFFEIWIIFVILYIFFVSLDKRFYKIIYKYRYVIVMLLLAICVILEFSGSSMSSWCNVLGVSAEESGVLFRTANPYRRDEFGVNTLFAIAQEKNPGDSYPYFSDIVRGTRTDMFIIYGQPVKSFGIIFRPFYWGYLLFGSVKGLSFFWCGRLLFLVMVSFEFGRILLIGEKIKAVIYSIFIAFSPVIQWWFAINGFVEMLIFGQLCALMLRSYIIEKKIWKKIFFSFIFFWSGAVFILVFYPAWQVVFGYIFLGIFIWIIFENRNKICWKGKTDIAIISFVGIVIGGILVVLLFKSKETIDIILHTAYPGGGSRKNEQLLEIKDIFGSIYNMYIPLIDSKQVIDWGFVDIFPLGIILSLYVLVKKKKDILLIILMFLEITFIIVFAFEVPVIVKQFTLLSQTICRRILIAIQFINILLLFRGISLIEFRGKIYKILVGVFICTLFVIGIFVNEVGESIPISKFMIIGMFISLFVFMLFFCLSYKHNVVRYLLIFSLMFFIVSGGLVNPVQQGLPFLEQSDLLDAIEEIVEYDSKGKWIVEGMTNPNTNIPLMGGAATINGTNVYPVLERWREFDPSGEQEYIYNRYAHISIELNNERKTEYKKNEEDDFTVYLNIKDLKKLQVNYILSTNNLEDLSDEEVRFDRQVSIEGKNIYKVIYQ